MLAATDAALVARTREGDSEAFGILVQRYLQASYAVALAQLGEPADAEDVCQDAFVTALKQIEGCRNPAQFGAWLLTIVRNRARDYRRYRSVRDALPLQEETAESARGDPERETENEELKAELLKAMKELTDLQREALLLYDFEGWSHKEIAEKLDISPESARVHLHNGRKALRQRLSPLYQEKR